MKYDYNYFHKNLLANQNVRYEQYKDKTEFDIFISHLSCEAIYDLTEIDWSLFVEQIVNMGIEDFCYQIGWEQVQFKVLCYLQSHLANLCKNTKLESKVQKSEKECARLISKIMNDRTPVVCHGDFEGMPPINFYEYMQSPTLYTDKTPMIEWIEMRHRERNRIYRMTNNKTRLQKDSKQIDITNFDTQEQKIKYLLKSNDSESGFSFLLHYNGENSYPIEMRNRWIYGDFCAEVVFVFDDFNRMCYIMDYRTSPNLMPPLIEKWIRQFLRERPSFDFNLLKEELYKELEEMMFDFVDCYFDYIGKDRWGIYLDYNKEHPECFWDNINFDETFIRHFRLDIWRKTIMEYGSAKAAITQSSLISDFIVSTTYTDAILSRIRDWANLKSKPKDKLMALRAAIDAGVIRRPTEKEFKTAFPDIKVPKSSLSDYTNPANTPYTDSAFSNLVEEFKQYK